MCNRGRKVKSCLHKAAGQIEQWRKQTRIQRATQRVTSAVWGGGSIRVSSSNAKETKRCGKNIFHTNRFDHSKPFSKEINVPNDYQINTIQTLKFMYKTIYWCYLLALDVVHTEAGCRLKLIKLSWWQRNIFSITEFVQLTQENLSLSMIPQISITST